MYYKWLNIEQLDNEEKMRFFAQMHKERFLWAKNRNFDERALLSAVCDNLSVQLASEFYSHCAAPKRQENGKPYFENSSLFVSHSHSGTFCISAVSTLPIGIDIEITRDIDMKLAKRICTQNENVNGPKELLTLWTLKEAYLKMLGTGICGGLKSVSFEISENGISCSDSGVLAELIDIPGCTGAICRRKA